MAAIVRMDYGSSTGLTITLNSLADNSSATSSIVSNASDRFMALDMQFNIVTGPGTSPNGYVTIYMERSYDGFIVDTAERQTLAVFRLNLASTIYKFSIDTTTAGSLPQVWKITVKNNTGDALAVAGNSVNYVGKKYARTGV
jgi:hypothetical protein